MAVELVVISKEELKRIIREEVESCLDKATSNQKREYNISLYPMMKTSEVARYLRVTTKTVLNWAKSGRIPYQRHGHQFVFKSEDVKRLGEIMKG